MPKKKIFDLHLDLEVYFRYPEFLNMKFKNLDVVDFKRHGDLPQFKRAGLKIAIVNIFPFEYVNNQWLPIKFNKFFQRLDNFLKWISKFNAFRLIKNNKELRNILESNKIGIILGVEGLNFLNQPDDIYKLIDRGIRVFGLNWNIDSKFSTSLKTTSKNGLTKDGLRLIKILEKLPVVVDLAHSSVYTFKDIVKYYKKPFIFSHNGIKREVDFEQNLDDEILKTVKERGGIIGLTFLPYAIQKKDKVSFLYWYRQFLYARKLCKDNLGLGTDFFGFKFNNNYKGLINYCDFYKKIITYRLPNYLLFDNAFRLFIELI